MRSHKQMTEQKQQQLWKHNRKIEWLNKEIQFLELTKIKSSGVYRRLATHMADRDRRLDAVKECKEMLDKLGEPHTV